MSRTTSQRASLPSCATRPGLALVLVAAYAPAMSRPPLPRPLFVDVLRTHGTRGAPDALPNGFAHFDYTPAPLPGNGSDAGAWGGVLGGGTVPDSPYDSYTVGWVPEGTMALARCQRCSAIAGHIGDLRAVRAAVAGVPPGDRAAHARAYQRLIDTSSASIQAAMGAAEAWLAGHRHCRIAATSSDLPDHVASFVGAVWSTTRQLHAPDGRASGPIYCETNTGERLMLDTRFLATSDDASRRAAIFRVHTGVRDALRARGARLRCVVAFTEVWVRSGPLAARGETGASGCVSPRATPAADVSRLQHAAAVVRTRERSWISGSPSVRGRGTANRESAGGETPTWALFIGDAPLLDGLLAEPDGMRALDG